MAHAGEAHLFSISDFKPEAIRGTPGFFRVGRTRRGQWWFVGPDDRPFFSKGVAGLNATGRVDGRSTPVGPYAATVERLYRPEAFIEAAVGRLKKWRFNTLGAGAASEFFEKGVPFVEMLDLRRHQGRGLNAFGARLPDVFDPNWPGVCEHIAAAVCASRRKSRELIGYFTDGELAWAQPSDDEAASGAKEVRPSLLQICLSLEPSTAAYHAAWEFALAARGGSLEALSRDWAAELPNKETLRQLTHAEMPLTTPGYLRDNRNFSREFAHRYFTVAASAIRRHDPNHLILGCRFAEPPGTAVLSECTYPAVDVISADVCSPMLFERIDYFSRAGHMPFLASAFAWNGGEFVQVRTAHEPGGMTSVERMLRRGRAVMERAFTHPALVGYAWPRWSDLAGEVPPFGSGLVHADDGEAREHTELLANLNARAEKIRRASAH